MSVQKILLKIKVLVLVLTLAGLTDVSAHSLSQDTYTLKVQDKPLSDVLKEISQLTGCKFIYSTTELKNAENVSFDLKDVSFDRLMEVCLEGTGLGGTTFGDYNLSDELIALFDKETDTRWNLFVTTYKYLGVLPGEDEPRICSFQYPGNMGVNVGEVFITEAEALVREGDIDGALWALNELRKKRYKVYEEITERDPDKLLQLVLDERRRECMFKGLRWFDLKRLNKDPRFVKTITHEIQGKTYTLEPDDNHYVLPIPLSVMSLNPYMVQNPR